MRTASHALPPDHRRPSSARCWRPSASATSRTLLERIPPKARLAAAAGAARRRWPRATWSRHLRALAERNADADRYVRSSAAAPTTTSSRARSTTCSSRGEFFTAYTPYQPEASQGTLRTIFEYQTMIAELTGMDVANASIYDGGSVAGRGGAHGAQRHGAGPDRRLRGAVTRSPGGSWRPTARARACRCKSVPWADGVTDLDALRKAVTDKTAASWSSTRTSSAASRTSARPRRSPTSAGALLVVVADPVDLGAARGRPGEAGADIVVGEGQGLGVPLSFGGPYLGRVRLPRRSSSAGCPAAWSAPPSTATASAASSSRCRRASSTSAARRRRRTSAPTWRCSR